MANIDNIALFDLDGSLADYDAALLADLELLRAPTEEPITTYNLRTLDNKKHIANRIHLIKNQPNWWSDLPPIYRGLDVLDICRKLDFHIAILTKGPLYTQTAWTEKLRWCQKHIDKDVDVTITIHKARVYGKVLYDDYPEYIMSWLEHRPRGLVIMPVTPHNKYLRHQNVIHHNGPSDLPKIETALRIARDRKPGETINYT